eukprot:8932577-Pyramimonas_sp.AAC.1
MNTKQIEDIVEQGALASVLYGCAAFGSPPSEIKHIRRQYGGALRRAWTGRCLSTLALEGSDPARTIPCAQITC